MRNGLVGLFVFAILAGCSGSGVDRGDGEHAAGNGDETGGAVDEFPPGIYYRAPALDQPESQLTGPGAAQAGHPLLPPVGFDIISALAIAPGGDSALVVLDPSGADRVVLLEGLHHVGRPTLSPDGKRAAVQATDYAPLCACPTDDFNIYVVDLTNGAWTRMGDLPYNEESPEWIPGSNEIAYSSFSPSEGVDLHVRDAATNLERLRIDDAGGIHLAASKDGSRLLEAGRALLWDVATGQRLADLRPQALAGMRAAGYETDPSFPGQGNRGTFPLDGDWSPDGQRLVFDGVVKGPTSGVLLFTMGVDGVGFETHAGPLQANGGFSNGHNFSVTNPHWVG